MSRSGMVLQTTDTAISPCEDCVEFNLCASGDLTEIRTCKAYRGYVSVQFGQANGRRGYKNEDKCREIEFKTSYLEGDRRDLNVL